MAGMNIRKPGTNIEDEIAGIACFSERNARYAMVEARPHEARGQRLFEVMQALVRPYQTLNYHIFANVVVEDEADVDVRD